MQTFLPKKPPINSYNTRSKSLDLLQNIAAQLPKLLLTNQVQSKINKLKKNDLSVDILI
ncbi:MAG: tryptophan 2,3-dioxygenase, partial [Candidatus Marinimicrobia bacterium]|nr:tryptophan 2,3-dioxygenase [Candidatus Neomarinimicrobiota bacterium]